MIGLCNIPPGSPLFGVDFHSARPRFDWDNVPSSSICERFEQQSSAKSARKTLRYLRDGRKVLGERVTQSQSADFCWRQTLFRSRLILHTREMLFNSSARDQQKQQQQLLCFSSQKLSNDSQLLKRLAKRKSKNCEKGVGEGGTTVEGICSAKWANSAENYTFKMADFGMGRTTTED